jgi:hypothetical protein
VVTISVLLQRLAQTITIQIPAGNNQTVEPVAHAVAVDIFSEEPIYVTLSVGVQIPALLTVRRCACTAVVGILGREVALEVLI